MTERTTPPSATAGSRRPDESTDPVPGTTGTHPDWPVARRGSTGRRLFLASGLAGTALLGLGAALAWRRDPGPGRRAILSALVPVITGAPTDAGTAQARAQCVADVETAIAGLSPATRDELAQLFALIDLGPTRLALTGTATAWPALAPETLAQILAAWRSHRLALLQVAYQALHDLVLGAWYARPENWPAIAYPGPPRLNREGA